MYNVIKISRIKGTSKIRVDKVYKKGVDHWDALLFLRKKRFREGLYCILNDNGEADYYKPNGRYEDTPLEGRLYCYDSLGYTSYLLDRIVNIELLF